MLSQGKSNQLRIVRKIQCKRLFLLFKRENVSRIRELVKITILSENAFLSAFCIDVFLHFKMQKTQKTLRENPFIDVQNPSLIIIYIIKLKNWSNRTADIIWIVSHENFAPFPVSFFHFFSNTLLFCTFFLLAYIRS